MGTRFNTEFNYRYQVEGNTPWEKIKILKGFLVGRKRAMVLEAVSAKKLEAKHLELKHIISMDALPHVILNLEAELMETESHSADIEESFRVTEKEIVVLEKLLAELYAVAEPTRIAGYTDDEMFEANAANEFTVWIAKEIQAEIIANGRPSPAKLRNAMSNPGSFEALKALGLLPPDTVLIGNSIEPFLEGKLANSTEAQLLTSGSTTATENPLDGVRSWN
jgi:hypothetical protein